MRDAGCAIPERGVASEVLSHFCCPLVTVWWRKFSRAVWAAFSGKPFSNALCLCKLGAGRLCLETSSLYSSASEFSWLMKMTRFGDPGTWVIYVDAVCQDTGDHGLPLRSSYCYLGLCSQVGLAPTPRACSVRGEHVIWLLVFLERPEEWLTSARDFVSLVHLGGTNSLLILFYFFVSLQTVGCLVWTRTQLKSRKTMAKQDYGWEGSRDGWKKTSCKKACP